MRTDLLRRVEEKVEECYQKAESYYSDGQTFPRPTIQYNLKGTCAGKAVYGPNVIRLNYTLLEENGDKFIGTTVPHEVAHLIVGHRYGWHIHHGHEWKRLMARILGVPAERCHRYDVSSVRVTLIFHCGCREHHVTKQKAAMHRNGTRTYRCAYCREVIRYGKKER